MTYRIEARNGNGTVMSDGIERTREQAISMALRIIRRSVNVPDDSPLNEQIVLQLEKGESAYGVSLVATS